ncbi:MAG: hypothetical protein HWE22_17350 [Flavobacteriales bacterium]|nr:hypothetical protein [Flavobacteriales bacterium]
MRKILATIIGFIVGLDFFTYVGSGARFSFAHLHHYLFSSNKKTQVDVYRHY